ncbi:hypothetical protein DDB_G0289799 [Dictyostelium discoideum AX4]|uniref:B box-type domain-containing protein n=1 Tax=Dictyostelium discoideum TaxID=44689 RepID=Q54H19_DICDI|nr:hypothetical protein DDB_G0289799 [Dictyostelium discoideum AX4]EAL62611.1 hypothetical protein DDB_G0289799 [Dictyostelium discoideum AX4]|eukprot:XP_636099.1 hypothetical protein DDB_G0289799 [Dictyostelium discoideum AX4]
MKSNQNIINNNIDNNKKCTLHPNKDIIFFCLDCKLIPCCIQCISSKGEHHGHRTDPLESTSNILSLMNNFKDDIHQKEGIAFKDNCNILSELKNKLPSHVMLLDGFNQKLTPGILPNRVKCLYLGDIKKELIIGSIPNTVTLVSLLNGFNQKLTPGILPDSVESLNLGDIKQELIIGSIPNTVTNVSLKDGFNQKLTPGILPDGLESLCLGDIKQELIIGSIPNTVKKVKVFQSFKHQIEPYVSKNVKIIQ